MNGRLIPNIYCIISWVRIEWRVLLALADFFYSRGSTFRSF